MSNEETGVKHSEWYGHGEGAEFSATFDRMVLRRIRKAVTDMRLIDVAATEEGLLIVGKDPNNVYGCNLVVTTQAMEDFSIGESGYVTFWDQAFRGGLDILEVIETDDKNEAAYQMSVGGDELEFTGPDGEFGAFLPAQSRYQVSEGHPPGPDFEKVLDVDSLDDPGIARANASSAFWNHAHDRAVGDGTGKAELAVTQSHAYLTFDGDNTTRKSTLEGAEADSEAITQYTAAHLLKALNAADFIGGGVDVYWGEKLPAVVTSQKNGLVYNGLVAPWLPGKKGYEVLHEQGVLVGVVQ